MYIIQEKDYFIDREAAGDKGERRDENETLESMYNKKPNKEILIKENVNGSDFQEFTLQFLKLDNDKNFNIIIKIKLQSDDFLNSSELMASKNNTEIIYWRLINET